MGNKSRRAVTDFLRQYKIKNITVQNLKAAMEKQGYTVVEFSDDVCSEDVSVLIREFGLKSYISSSKGFTYADSNYRLVFVNSELSEYEKLIVLAHEEGHIFCNHFAEANIIGRNVVQEYEANEFAHYLLNPDMSMRIYHHRKQLFMSAAVIAVILIACYAVRSYRAEQSYYGEYYVTDTGHKYHEAGCIYVKEKTNIRRLTKEEFESSEYEPCGMCLPH